jgi:hypothetical protein
LIKIGADVIVENNNGETAFEISLDSDSRRFGNDFPITQAIINADPAVLKQKTKSGQLVFEIMVNFIKAKKNNGRILKEYLYNAVKNLPSLDENGTTPTVYALKNSSLDLAEKFKNNQEKNKTLLEIALENNLYEIAPKIIEESNPNICGIKKGIMSSSFEVIDKNIPKSKNREEENINAEWRKKLNAVCLAKYSQSKNS